MKNFKAFLLWIWTELKQGNMFVVGGLIVAYVYVALPLYGEFLEWRAATKLNSQMNTEIAVNQSLLWEKLEKLEKKNQIDYINTKEGMIDEDNF